MTVSKTVEEDSAPELVEEHQHTRSSQQQEDCAGTVTTAATASAVTPTQPTPVGDAADGDEETGHARHSHRYPNHKHTRRNNGKSQGKKHIKMNNMKGNDSICSGSGRTTATALTATTEATTKCLSVSVELPEGATSFTAQPQNVLFDEEEGNDLSIHHHHHDDDDDDDCRSAVSAEESSSSSSSTSSANKSLSHSHHDEYDDVYHRQKKYRDPGMPESTRHRRRILWKPFLIVVVVGLIIVIVTSVLVGKGNKSRNSNNDEVSSTIFCCSGKQFSSNGLNRSKDVMEFLIDARISSTSDVETSGTPQYQAAMWIADYDMMKVPIPVRSSSDSTRHANRATSSDVSATTSSSDSNIMNDNTGNNADVVSWNRPNDEVFGMGFSTFVHRYVLAVLYFALNKEGTWPNDLSFLSPKHVCEWTSSRHSSSGNALEEEGQETPVGVFECSENDFGEQVPSALSLSFHGLIGTIPDNEFRHLDLETLDLSNNKALTGDIPLSIQAMTRLKHLALDHCTFHGGIPSFIGQLTELQLLTLGNNKLSGTVPPSIRDLKKLEVLGLDDNSLEASIELFGPLGSLTHLYLDDNRRIDGSLTSSLLGQWSNLEVLDLSENKIDSTLPMELFTHPSLRVVDLHSNFLRGNIPEVVAEENLSLEFLSLHSNLLTGSIHETIGRLQSMRYLDISKNHLSGSIPSSLGNLSLLKSLFLGNNNFLPNPFPSQIQFLTMLEELSLQNIGLVGQLPAFLDQLSNLVFFDVSKNFLSTGIPESLGRIPNLRFLILRENKLTSTIPSTFSDLKNLDMLLLEGNAIAGNADVICKADAVKPQMFIADCNNESDFRCECCTECCGASNTCNDNDWFAHIDSTWEAEYQREHYSFGQGVTFSNECFTDEP